MVELADLFKPEKRYLIGKKIIDLNNCMDEILIKIGNRILRCQINDFQQQTVNPFAYVDYNAPYCNQTTVSTARGPNQYFAMNTWQNGTVNLNLSIYGEIRI